MKLTTKGITIQYKLLVLSLDSLIINLDEFLTGRNGHFVWCLVKSEATFDCTAACQKDLEKKKKN